MAPGASYLLSRLAHEAIPGGERASADYRLRLPTSNPRVGAGAKLSNLPLPLLPLRKFGR
jgi:hypothetical protein